MIPFHLDWIASGGVLSSIWLTSHKKWQGWAVSVVLNLTVLPAINILCGTYAMLLLNVICLWMAARATVKWRQEALCSESSTARS